VGLKLIFPVVTRAVPVLGLSRREAWWKDAEILMLRHQLAVALRERPRAHSRLTWPACAETSSAQVGAVVGGSGDALVRVAPGWFLSRGSANCGMMIGCAAATGLPERDERVRVTAESRCRG
jgi:hypothetical protein